MSRYPAHDAVPVAILACFPQPIASLRSMCLDPRSANNLALLIETSFETEIGCHARRNRLREFVETTRFPGRLRLGYPQAGASRVSVKAKAQWHIGFAHGQRAPDQPPRPRRPAKAV
jgi:hypothetical protein